MKPNKNIIRRITNTLNEFIPLNFYEVGIFDINCEHIRNDEETVLIRVDEQEVIIMLRNKNAVKYKDPLFRRVHLQYKYFKTFTALMCLIFATVKEYYDEEFV
ncbi:MAG: hypothetical protein IJX16_00170 [Clostridia bacterium]|nr:hypothetical protein [Clostridia bacterium]